MSITSRVFPCLVAAILLSGRGIYAEEPKQLFTVVQDGKWGYIDRTGNVIIAPQFQQASEFSEGVAAVNIDGKWGYIDQKGQIVIEPQFAFA